MTEKTTRILSCLEQADLFHAVGKRDCDDYNFASSWMEAMAYCVGSKWKDVLIDGTSTLREKIFTISEARYDAWESLHGQIRPLFLDLARKKTEHLIQSQALPDKFMFAVLVSWLGIGFEAEYADLVAPSFYSKVILDCYLKGHFACGWDGEFPAGKLIVY